MYDFYRNLDVKNSVHAFVKYTLTKLHVSWIILIRVHATRAALALKGNVCQNYINKTKCQKTSDKSFTQSTILQKLLKFLFSETVNERKPLLRADSYTSIPNEVSLYPMSSIFSCAMSPKFYWSTLSSKTSTKQLTPAEVVDDAWLKMSE